MRNIRVRQAPSPTGKLHIGNAHTFLFNYCFARHSGGEVKLRIEDTDPVRSKAEFSEDIKDALTWLGLTWDGDPVYQSQKPLNYLEHAEKLLASGDAYYCYHTAEELEKDRRAQEAKGMAPRYSGECRSLTPEQIESYKKEGHLPSIRFRMTGEDRPQEISYLDLVYGEIKYNPEDIGDFIIVRADKSVLYNFGNVVDDHDMGITHVIRGQSHLTNTPRQILIYQALGWDVPQFGHLPEILNPDRVGKLSKRYGATSVTEFRDKGYLPEAIVNFLGSLGWSHPEGKEFFDLPEMVKNFSFDRVSKAPAALDLEKLDDINGYYIRNLEKKRFVDLCLPYLKDFNVNEDKKLDTLNEHWESFKERMNKLSDISNSKIAGGFFQEPEEVKIPVSETQAKTFLSAATTSLEQLPDWNQGTISEALKSVQQENEYSKDFYRVIGSSAVSGSTTFPPLFESLEGLGREETIERLKKAPNKLEPLNPLS